MIHYYVSFNKFLLRHVPFAVVKILEIRLLYLVPINVYRHFTDMEHLIDHCWKIMACRENPQKTYAGSR